MLLHIKEFLSLPTKTKNIYIYNTYHKNILPKIEKLPETSFYKFGESFKYKIEIYDTNDNPFIYIVDQFPYVFKITHSIANLYDIKITDLTKTFQVYQTYIKQATKNKHFDIILYKNRSNDVKLTEIFLKLTIFEKTLESLNFTYCKYYDIHKDRYQYLALQIENDKLKIIDTLEYIYNYTPLFINDETYLIGSYNQNNKNRKKKIDLKLLRFNTNTKKLDPILSADRLSIIKKYQTYPEDQQYSHFLQKDNNEIFSIKDKTNYIINTTEEIKKIILYRQKKDKDVFIIKGKSKNNKLKFYMLTIENIKKISIEEIHNQNFINMEDVIFQLKNKIYLPVVNPHTSIPSESILNNVNLSGFTNLEL